MVTLRLITGMAGDIVFIWFAVKMVWFVENEIASERRFERSLRFFEASSEWTLREEDAEHSKLN